MITKLKKLFKKKNKTPTVGIIGGLGPKTTSELYHYFTSMSRQFCQRYPSIIIDSISFPFVLEKHIMQEMRGEDKLLPELIASTKRLNNAGADFIILASNTLHMFISELRDVSKVPVLSVLTETIKEVMKGGYEKVAILGSSRTIALKFYEIPLKTHNIKVLRPYTQQQKRLQDVILRVLDGKSTKQDAKFTHTLISDLKKRGADAIILAVGDLHAILKKDYGITIIDSMKALSDATFKKLMDPDCGEIK